jgi:transcriptional regulator with XRE-family HTH domain
VIIVIAAPPVRRRLVGGALRRYRENLGYTLEDAARILECDRSKISRIETGQRGIRAKELRELLAEYGIGEQQATLAAIADPRGARRWYETYADVLPGAYQDYLFLETVASRVSAYEAQRVPALLQTPAYARALAEADPSLADDDARDTAIEATLARQKAILGERNLVIAFIVAILLAPARALPRFAGRCRPGRGSGPAGTQPYRRRDLRGKASESRATHPAGTRPVTNGLLPHLAALGTLHASRCCHLWSAGQQVSRSAVRTVLHIEVTDRERVS